MSVAFQKEPLGVLPEDLPERPISAHRNLVTPRGAAWIDAEARRLEDEIAILPRDTFEGRATLARAMRDRRYWLARRATMEVVAPPSDHERARFGSTVRVEREDGRLGRYTIVGEDEADPARGLIFHASPVARALMGKQVGDEARVNGAGLTIVAIE